MLSAFGLVTQSHAANFVPFNSTQVSNVTTTTPIGSDNQNSTAGVTDDQRDDAYQQWLKSR
jgi:mannan endo-1,4-beta-mannosidase